MGRLKHVEEKIKEKSVRKDVKDDKKKVRKVKKKLNMLSSNQKEILEIRRKRYIFEACILGVLAILLLILLCNRTFFREEYRTSKIDIDIPLLTFFIKDSDGEIVLKTLRKSDYLREYFDSYLSNFTRYSCNDINFYYNELTRTAIYDISVDKTFAIKTIKIKYSNGDADCLCSGEKRCE